jgi:uncharacterized phiE125 gp8 family phage protein
VYGLTLITAATEEPLLLSEAKKQVELATQDTAHDEHLLRLIKTARQYAEEFTGRALVTQTWDFYLDQWPIDNGMILLPKSPLASVTHVKYYDDDGTQQTWSSSNYVVQTSREPGRVSLAYGQSWPSARYQPDSIVVRFVAGAARASVPDRIKAAMLLLIGHWFDHREEVNIGSSASEVPFAANALLQQSRIGDEFWNYEGVC